MKFIVNENCIGCGLCPSLCPKVFEMKGDVAVAIKTEVPKELEKDATDAKNSCPVNAIENN